MSIVASDTSGKKRVAVLTRNCKCPINTGRLRENTINKIVHEELVSVGKTTTDTKEASHDIIATTLREKIHVPKEQFKAYFLALMADKEYTRIFDTISKVDKSFKHPAPYFCTQARGNLSLQTLVFMTEKSTSLKPDIVITNELQWTDINGSVIVGAQGMANNAHVPVADIALVLQGKSLADMSCLDFRDPN
ncbi:unnamed protein product, partial [Porites evermanni]